MMAASIMSDVLESVDTAVLLPKNKSFKFMLNIIEAKFTWR
jgi:hypothetical protein